jgi:hypothetical protein
MLTFRPRTKSRWLRWLETFVIVLLTLAMIWLWMGGPFDDTVDDADSVTLEYKCSELDTYDHVPTEVHDECIKRLDILRREMQKTNPKTLL